MDYELLVTIEVMEFVERLPRRTGRAIRDAMHAIRRDPLGNSEAEDRDEIGRLLHIA